MGKGKKGIIYNITQHFMSKFRKYILLFLSFSLIVSCEIDRIDFISKYSGLVLPESYDVLVNKTESSGFAGADFEITIILDFDLKNFKILTDQISDLSIKNKHWTVTDTSYKYYYEITDSEFEKIELDIDNRRLIYTMINI